jgi:hypothetical protein
MRVDDAPVAEILAVLRRLPPRDRMDVLAVAVRAALDSETLDATAVGTAGGGQQNASDLPGVDHV